MGRIALPNFKMFTKYPLLKSVWYWRKNRKLFHVTEECRKRSKYWENLRLPYDKMTFQISRER